MEDIGLPEDVLVQVISFAAEGPRAACVLATVSPSFRTAADSDTVWSRFLPADLAPLASPVPPPRSKKDIFLHLSGTPALLPDDLKVRYIYVLYAENLLLLLLLPHEQFFIIE